MNLEQSEYIYCVRVFGTFPRHDLLMLWNSISDHVLLPLLLDGFRKMSIHPELITLSLTDTGARTVFHLSSRMNSLGAIIRSLNTSRTFSLWSNQYQESADSCLRPSYTCVPGVLVMMSALRVLNPTNTRTTLFPSPSVGTWEEDVLIFNDSHPDWKLDVNTGHDY